MMFDLKHHHAAMSVPDLESSITWYDRVLDFKVEARFHIPAIPADCAMLKREGMRIELFQAKDGGPAAAERRHPDTDASTHGNKHAAFAIKDVDEAEESLRERAADIVFVMKHDFGANIFIRDNAGNLIEFVYQPEMFA
jgi:methylmalonyl-CoA/ethylmalonyl-CoA epimerase